MRSYQAIAPTASDSVSEPFGVADAIQFIKTGSATILTEGGVTLILASAPCGALFPIRVKRVNSTSLTADAVILLYERI